MKWAFYVVVFVYMFYRAVYGAKQGETVNSLTVEPIVYANDVFLPAGARQNISCKGTSLNQKLEWVDPLGHVVKRFPKNRVFAKEQFVSRGGRVPALVLTISKTLVSDTGVYKCRSGDLVKEVELCVIEPSEFVDTPTEVTADLGRSITLTCQAKGLPEPRLVWNKNHEIISDEESSTKYKVMTKYNSQGFESLLTITSLEPQDSGAYACISMQENQLIDNCADINTFNISLQVNYAPIFADGNDTKIVYGKASQEVHLECSADAFPTPSYRWFRDEGSNLYEFSQKELIYSETENKAVLVIMATPTTFGQKFKCIAKNDRGESEKYFTLMKMEKPRKPDEVYLTNATDSRIQFNVTWSDKIYFPVGGFDIQYLKMNEGEGNKKLFSGRKEAEWRRAKQVVGELEENDDSDFEYGGILVTLTDLDEETHYWVRLRATNSAGDSPWSNPTPASTTTKPEEAELPETPQPTASAEVNYTTATFYGIFFAGGILVVAVVCMFAMRVV